MSARRPWAWPLVPLYAFVLILKDELRRIGFPRQRSLAWPVISIGSISAGGAGKTPVVIALARLLQERGLLVNVLSRGYGRSSSEVARVELSRLGAARFYGDEPVLIAQATRADVWVGADRYTAGTRAEQASDTRGVHLLDDGFQHRRLKRSVDIVLVTAQDLSEALLPAGNRRDSLDSIGLANIVVIREEEREAVEPLVLRRMREGALLWSIRRTLRFPAPLGVLSAGLRPVALCAIARPENFAAMLQEAGCGIVDTITYGDHHDYNLRNMAEITTIARRLDASGFVTTAKDAVKLTPAMIAQLEAIGPVVVVQLEAEFLYPERVARELEARLA